MSRKKTPESVEANILTKSKRRCAFCFGLDNVLEEKAGQIAHIDGDNQNNREDNLAFLCFEHHDKYDSISSQSKGYKPKELKYYRDKLYEYNRKESDKKLQNNKNNFYKIDKIHCIEPKTCKSISKVLNWDSDLDSLRETKNWIIEEFISQFKELPINSRKFINVVLKMSEFNNGRYTSRNPIVLIYKIESSLKINSEIVKKELAILDNYIDFVEYNNKPYIEIYNETLISIKKYADISEIPLEKIIIDLDFTLLD